MPFLLQLLYIFLNKLYYYCINFRLCWYYIISQYKDIMAMVKFLIAIFATTFILMAKSYVDYASWYGKKFQGQLTASGLKYDMYSYTAAHKYLPLGTVVRVTNLKNGKWVDVKITDRGPYAYDRMIDLSYIAAKKIELVKQGVAKVKMQVLYVKPSNKRG